MKKINLSPLFGSRKPSTNTVKSIVVRTVPIELDDVEQETRITNQNEVKEITKALDLRNKSSILAKLPSDYEVEFDYHSGEKETFLIKDKYVKTEGKVYRLSNGKLSLKFGELFED